MAMTREECESKVVELVKEIDRVINEYCPNNGYWTASVSDSGCITINNAYWEGHKKINYWEDWKGGEE